MATRAIIGFLAMVAASIVLAGSVQAHELPLGDGKVSTQPERGHVYSCQTEFRGGGAHRRGEWIGADSWDPARKPRVSGRVDWPNARIDISLDRDTRIVSANNLPLHETGTFPISRGDDAYRYDRNPNSIRAQNILLRLPAMPHRADTPACVPMGMIGFALSGGAIYNALDAMGRDAPAHEIQDACDGHPQRSGQYHYHGYSECLTDSRAQPDGHSDLVGYAIDGFGIFGLRGQGGGELDNADLDACHGHTHKLVWDGASTDIYHYHMTREYPYTIGCFRGAVDRAAFRRPPPDRRGGAPPDGPSGPHPGSFALPPRR